MVYPPEGGPYSRSAYYKGQTDARRDLRSGHLAVEAYGFPPRGYLHYVQILQDRYHVTVKNLGDVLDSTLIGHARGYNSVSKTEIKRRFGPDVFRGIELSLGGDTFRGE